jgi:hypothetical protein
MGGSGHALVYRLRAFHAARPRRLRICRCRTATKSGSDAAQWTHDRRATRFGDAAQSSGAVSARCPACYRGRAAGATCECTTRQPGTAGCETGASRDDAACRQARSNSGTGAELRSTRYDAVGNAGPENAEAKQ